MDSHKIIPQKKRTNTRFSVRWAGEAGDGLQSTNLFLCRFLNKLDLFVQSHPGTQSTIRGGHVWVHTEFSQSKFHFFNREVDFLIVLNTHALNIHLNDLKNKGILLTNSQRVKISDTQLSKIRKKKIRFLEIPLTTLAKEVHKLSQLINTVTMGIFLGILNLDIDYFIKESLKKRFHHKPKILDINIESLNKGYSYFINNIKTNHFEDLYIEEGTLGNTKKIVITGNQMIALGAAASGLKYLAQYPITPASSILTYLSQHATQLNIVVKQVEDEIAAIISALGASWTGARSMTATSGPGFSLMAEAIGFSGMTETPLVIVLSMRAGPSTGIPTKMEQADLLFALNSSHGEFPKAIIAPRNIKECFSATVRAFNIADRYQLPVILLSDFALSEIIETVPEFSLDVEIDRGKIWTEPTPKNPEFKRYKITEDGVSSRALPSVEGGIHVLVGAEHDENSHSLSGNLCGLPESGEMREKMIKKRFRKLNYLSQEMQCPDWYGHKNADFTIICWGSTEGAVKESIDLLNQNSEYSWNMLSFVDIFPLPSKKVKMELKKIKTGILFEINYTGQLEILLYQETGWKPSSHVHLLSGETPTASIIVPEMKNIIESVMLASSA